MAICVSCGQSGNYEICPHHTQFESFSEENRIWCDFFHRGIVRSRVSLEDREPVSVLDAE